MTPPFKYMPNKMASANGWVCVCVCVRACAVEIKPGNDACWVFDLRVW